MMLSDQVLSLLTSVSALKYYYIFQKLDILPFQIICIFVMCSLLP